MMPFLPRVYFYLFACGQLDLVVGVEWNGERGGSKLGRESGRCVYGITSAKGKISHTNNDICRGE